MLFSSVPRKAISEEGETQGAEFIIICPLNGLKAESQTVPLTIINFFYMIFHGRSQAAMAAKRLDAVSDYCKTVLSVSSRR